MESSEEVGKKIVAKTLHVFESSHIHFLKPYKSNINYIIIIIRLNLGLFSSDIFILRFVDIVGLLNLSLYISSRHFKCFRHESTAIKQILSEMFGYSPVIYFSDVSYCTLIQSLVCPLLFLTWTKMLLNILKNN